MQRILCQEAKLRESSGFFGEDPEEITPLGARTLWSNISEGKEWESDPKVGMIAKNDALAMAESIIEGREYDLTAKPLVLLIDDLYMVTFWKPNRMQLQDYAFTYDSRVGIDAYTGKFVAKEIPK